ncbi:hypothetical protein ACOMHN_025505 [Nucella lapillus]
MMSLSLTRASHLPSNASDANSDVISNNDVSTPPVIVDEILLSSDNLIACLQKNGRLEYFTKSFWTQLYLPRSSDRTANTSLTCSLTLSTASHKAFEIDLWEIHTTACSQNNYISFRDGKNVVTWYYTCSSELERFPTKGNRVTIDVHVKDQTALQMFTITADAILVTTKLHLFRLSSTQGYIQTPGHDQKKRYPAFLNVWETISPPSGHVTLLSMRRLDIEQADYWGKCSDFVELFADGRTAEDRVWRVCGFRPPPPRVLHAAQLHVHFVSDARSERPGFKLLYSFHPQGRSPSRGPGGLWNCSVPEWSEFQSHFDCNLERECEGGRMRTPVSTPDPAGPAT